MPNLLDYSTWTPGVDQNFTGFNRYTSSGENVAKYAPDPWGKVTTVWEVNPVTGSPGYSGGFYTEYSITPVDINYDYRFSCYFKRVQSYGGGYNDYFGTNSFNSSVVETTMERIPSGGPVTNPYFSYWYGTAGTVGEWLLVIARIRRNGWTDMTIHPESGVWDMTGTKVGGLSYEYIFAATSYYTRMRAFYYENSPEPDPDFIQQWCYPRIEKCDGSELSFDWLMRGSHALMLGKATGLGSVLVSPKSWH